MGIIYLFSVGVLLISFVLIEKKKKKIDLTVMLALSIVLLFCYNVLICYLLTFLKIPISLGLLTIINLTISIVLLGYTFAKKKRQKYKVINEDFIYIILIAFIVFIVSIFNFGFPFEIKYESGDAPIHFGAAKTFSQSDRIANEGTGEPHNYKTFKIGSYVNSGLLMKALSDIVPVTKYYTIFIWFSIFVLFISAYIMYASLANLTKKNWQRFLAFLVSVIYVLGYPLNSMLFGFEYLSMSLVLISAIVLVMECWRKQEISYWFWVVSLFLLNFSLFCSYYLFVPFVYTAIFLTIAYFGYKKSDKWIKNKNSKNELETNSNSNDFSLVKNEKRKILDKETIFTLIVTLIIPFIMAYIYSFMPNLYNLDFSGFFNEFANSTAILNGFSGEGHIYRNLYSNMILWLPFALYESIKYRKENVFNCILFSLTIMTLLILFIGSQIGIVSTYYLAKMHYAFWGIIIYISFKGIIHFSDKRKLVPIIFIGAYILILITSLICKNVKLEHKKNNTNENITSVTEVFDINKTIILDSNVDLTANEIKEIEYVKNNLDFSKIVEVIGDPEQLQWVYQITGYMYLNERTAQYHSIEIFKEKLRNIDITLEEADYVVYLKRSFTYEVFKEKILASGNIIYENDSIGIVERN